MLKKGNCDNIDTVPSPTEPPVTINKIKDFFSNSEAFASEFLENLEQIFPRYYLHSYLFNRIKSLSTKKCVGLHYMDLTIELCIMNLHTRF